MVRLVTNLSLFAAFLVLAAQDISADTLFRKKAAVAIGFGETDKSQVHWENCSHNEAKAFIKPPYWVDKSDNCRVTASQFGLDKSGQLYVVTDLPRASAFFPDAKLGKVVGYENDSATGFVLLTFGTKSIRLPYDGPMREDQVISNELSVAEAFVNIGEVQPANDLLEDAYNGLREVHASLFSTAFITDAYVSLVRIKQVAPSLAAVSHSSFIQFTYLRSTLEKVPSVQYQQGGCSPIFLIKGTARISHSNFDFGAGSPCGFSLPPFPGGESRHLFVESSFIHGGTQVLDGIAWDHDVFVESHIQYRGGEVSLGAVQFVNCTFEIVDSPRGDRVIDLAILGGPLVSIQGDAKTGFNITPGQSPIADPSSRARNVPTGLGLLF